jgi:hypothetical protein
MEEELINALDELRKYKTRYRQMKSFVVEQKEKQITCERMEAEIVHLRKELDAKLIQTKYENSSKILDKIITTQRDSGNKNGIGYSQEKSKLIQNLMQILSSVHSRRKMKRRQEMIRTPEDHFHPSRKKIIKYQRSSIKTCILSFSLVIVLHALILDTKL